VHRKGSRSQSIRTATRNVVHIVGELDLLSAPALRDCLQAVAYPVVLDFAAVTFMDSSAIGALVAAHKRRELSGNVIMLRDLPSPPRGVAIPRSEYLGVAAAHTGVPTATGGSG
jgi:anti-anti-sigma factor